MHVRKKFLRPRTLLPGGISGKNFFLLFSGRGLVEFSPEFFHRMTHHLMCDRSDIRVCQRLDLSLFDLQYLLAEIPVRAHHIRLDRRHAHPHLSFKPFQDLFLRDLKIRILLLFVGKVPHPEILLPDPPEFVPFLRAHRDTVRKRFPQIILHAVRLKYTGIGKRKILHRGSGDIRVILLNKMDHGGHLHVIAHREDDPFRRHLKKCTRGKEVRVGAVLRMIRKIHRKLLCDHFTFPVLQISFRRRREREIIPVRADDEKRTAGSPVCIGRIRHGNLVHIRRDLTKHLRRDGREYGIAEIIARNIEIPDRSRQCPKGIVQSIIRCGQRQRRLLVPGTRPLIDQLLDFLLLRRDQIVKNDRSLAACISSCQLPDALIQLLDLPADRLETGLLMFILRIGKTLEHPASVLNAVQKAVILEFVDQDRRERDKSASHPVHHERKLPVIPAHIQNRLHILKPRSPHQAGIRIQECIQAEAGKCRMKAALVLGRITQHDRNIAIAVITQAYHLADSGRHIFQLIVDLRKHADLHRRLEKGILLLLAGTCGIIPEDLLKTGILLTLTLDFLHRRKWLDLPEVFDGLISEMAQIVLRCLSSKIGNSGQSHLLHDRCKECNNVIFLRSEDTVLSETQDPGGCLAEE